MIFARTPKAHVLQRIVAGIAVVLCLAVLLRGTADAAGDGDEVVCEMMIMGNTLLMTDGGCEEIVLGNFVADAVREAADADVALINFGDFEPSKRLFYGTVTRQHVDDMFASDRQIAVAEVTVTQLWDILEYSASHLVVDLENESLDHEASSFEGFLSVSGISVTYDAPTRTIYSLSDSDGNRLSRDDDRTFLVAASDYMFSGGYGFPAVEDYETVGVWMADATADYLAAIGEVEDYDTGRVSVIGTSDNKLISYIPIWIFVVIILIVLLWRLFLNPKRRFDL